MNEIDKLKRCFDCNFLLAETELVNDNLGIFTCEKIKIVSSMDKNFPHWKNPGVFIGIM